MPCVLKREVMSVLKACRAHVLEDKGSGEEAPWRVSETAVGERRRQGTGLGSGGRLRWRRGVGGRNAQGVGEERERREIEVEIVINTISGGFDVAALSPWFRSSVFGNRFSGSGSQHNKRVTCLGFDIRVFQGDVG